MKLKKVSAPFFCIITRLSAGGCFFRNAACVVFVLFLAAGCSGKKSSAVVAPDAAAEWPAYEPAAHEGPAWAAVALLETGVHPIWFELGPDGPFHIASPDAASLHPYKAWPHARFIAGIQLWNEFLVMAVNQEGFLALGPAAANNFTVQPHDIHGLDDSRILLYRIPGGPHWEPYTAESFFFWNNKPAALLYLNDFFIEHNAPAPESRVYILDTDSPYPLTAKIPSLENNLSGGAWEAEIVRRGGDGFWYYRMKDKDRGETAYFRTAGLEEAGRRISAGEWRDSNLPEKPENTPPALAAVLGKFQETTGSAGVFTARTVSPDFTGQRSFRSNVNSPVNEHNTALYAYCRAAPALALAVRNDGTGFAAYGENREVRPFTLPSLPEGFVYTGIAALEPVIICSWEEQQEAGIGAAGFMVMKL